MYEHVVSIFECYSSTCSYSYCLIYVTIPLFNPMCIGIVIPARVELESNYSLPTASNDSNSATAVGLLLGGLAAGVTGVLLIEGIACAACRLWRIKHKWVHNISYYFIYHYNKVNYSYIYICRIFRRHYITYVAKCYMSCNYTIYVEVLHHAYTRLNLRRGYNMMKAIYAIVTIWFCPLSILTT